MTTWYDVPFRVDIHQATKNNDIVEMSKTVNTFNLDVIVFWHIICKLFLKTYAINIKIKLLILIIASCHYLQVQIHILVLRICHYVTGVLDEDQIIEQDVTRVNHGDSANDMKKIW